MYILEEELQIDETINPLMTWRLGISTEGKDSLVDRQQHYLIINYTSVSATSSFLGSRV